MLDNLVEWIGASTINATIFTAIGITLMLIVYMS